MDQVVIIGAGPSGLAAAWELSRNGVHVVLIERLGQVGGLARTIRKNNALFDMGPHRFFTKNSEIHQLWTDLLEDDLLSVNRLTRIFFNNKYFYYPLAPLNALFGIGPMKAIGIVSSYLSAGIKEKISPTKPITFEDWVVAQFGRKLFDIFFKTYTEKVWGIPCSQIGADWAGQRIKGLSLWKAVVNSIVKPKSKNIKTLADEFVYPRHGAGMLFEKMADFVELYGGEIKLNHEVIGFKRDGREIKSVIVKNSQGEIDEIEGRTFLFSSPITDGVLGIDPEPPPEVISAANSLRYRNHIGVDLEVEGNPFPDNWIYVHSREVNMARIANYRNFSEEMAGDSSKSPMTVEYFCSQGDHIWDRTDEGLIDLAKNELYQMRILHPDQVHTNFVVRNKKAYPVIELGYDKKLEVLKRYISGFENLQPIGRSGMFKYNNMDHAIMTGLLAARNILGGNFDVWSVNIDAEYQESGEVLSHKSQVIKSSKTESEYTAIQ